MEQPPSTPEKRKLKPSNGPTTPTHKQLATPVPSSPLAPRTPEQKTPRHRDRVAVTPKSQRINRVPLTPGSRLYLPVSPANIRPWQSAKSRPSSSSLSVNAQIPPMPLPTLFLTKEEVEKVPEDELRSNLVKAVETIESYERSTKQFRNLANHYLLQSKLQSFETQESAQRHEVERDINKREIERLVLDFVGQNEQTIDLESIRRRLKKTRQRLKDLEHLCSDKDREIIELRTQLKAQRSMPQMHTMNTSPTKQPHRLPNIHVPPPENIQGSNFSPLELLATQVLTDRMQHRRRGSSASTISATSDDEMK